MLIKEINDAIQNSRLDEKFVDIEKKMAIEAIVNNEGAIQDGVQRTTLAIFLSLAREDKLKDISNFNEARPEEDIIELLKVANKATVLELAASVLNILEMKDKKNSENDYDAHNDIVDLMNKINKAQE